jgi:hypothetical protein
MANLNSKLHDLRAMLPMSDEAKLRHALFAHIEQKTDEVWKSIDSQGIARGSRSDIDQRTRVITAVLVLMLVTSTLVQSSIANGADKLSLERNRTIDDF